SINARRDTGIAHLGVYRVGEVDRRGADRQFLDLALRRKDIDLVGKQVDLDALDKLHRVAGLLLHFQQATHPRLGTGVRRRTGITVSLVQPVRRDAVVGHGIHFLGANLYFQRNTRARLQRGVQRLVAVCLRDGDVILETAGNRREVIVRGTEHAITGVDAINYNAKTV